jgi:hypothetical protein
MNFFERLFRQNLMNKTMGSNSVAPDGIVRNNAPNNGLLSNNNKGFFGSFNNINPNLILGANMIGQGIQGKDPFSSFAPALQQTGQLQSQFMQMEEMKNKMAENKKARELADKQRNFFDNLPDDSPYKEIAEAFPKVAVTGILNERLKSIELSNKNKLQKKKDIKEAFKNIQDQENEFFKNYNDDKQIENFNESTTQLKKMLSSLEQNTGAGDVAAIFAFMKTLDPNSVVRESEFEVAEGTGGSALVSFEKAFQKWQKLRKGERLTDRERENFKKAAIEFHNASEGSIDNIRTGYEKIAENRGLNIENIFVDNDLRPLFVNNKVPDGPPGQTKDVINRLPKGTKLADYQDGFYFFRLPNGSLFKIKG